MADHTPPAGRRWGMTIPFDGVPLHRQREWYVELADLGYTDVWSSEADGSDAFTPLVLASQWAPALRLGCAIVPAFTRGPALMAQSIGALAQAAPGRFAFGLGTSSNVIVERWNAIPFEAPYQRVKDTLRFLRRALAGEKIDERYASFAVRGFRLQMAPLAEQPPILVAALREGMLRLAGREGDGAILNWLSADDVRRVAPLVHAGGPDKQIVARLFVIPSADRTLARAIGRRAAAAYLTVPVYAAYHEWLGRGDVVAKVSGLWNAGDRKAAVEAIPDEVVDALVIHGSPGACREHVERYRDAGVTTPVLALLHADDLRTAIRQLAPAAA